MIDNEIIKALAYCSMDIFDRKLMDKDGGCRKDLCYQAALSESKIDTTMCRQRVMEDAFCLINRKRVEIRKLKRKIAGYRYLTKVLSNKVMKEAKKIQKKKKTYLLKGTTK